jgi:hypothetical protein
MVILILSLSDKAPARGLENGPSKKSGRWKHLSKTAKFIFLAIFLMGIFYLFADSTHLLGDGFLRAGEVEKANPRPGIFWDTYASEPLEYFIHKITYDNIFSPLGLSSIFCFMVWSYIAGLIFIWAAWSIAIKLQNRYGGAGFIFSYILGWAGVMLFFGYVEDYSLTAAAWMLYFNFSVNYLDSGKGTYWPIGLYLLGFSLHNITITLLPSLFYIYYFHKKKHGANVWLSLIGILIITIGWSCISIYNRHIGTLLLFESRTQPGYFLWSSAHLLDIMNLLLLVSPAILILISIQKWRDPIFRKDHLRNFFWIAALPGIIGLFILDPLLGMGRDWDLFALMLLGLHLALFAGADWNNITRLFKISICVIGISFTFVNVLINRNMQQSITRYKNIAALDTARARYGYERLGYFLGAGGYFKEAEEILKLSIKIAPHPQTSHHLGQAQFQLGKTEEAMENFRRTIALSTNYPDAYYKLSEYYFSIGQWTSSREMLEKYAEFPEARHDSLDIASMFAELDQRIAAEHNRRSPNPVFK